MPRVTSIGHNTCLLGGPVACCQRPRVRADPIFGGAPRLGEPDVRRDTPCMSCSNLPLQGQKIKKKSKMRYFGKWAPRDPLFHKSVIWMTSPCMSKNTNIGKNCTGGFIYIWSMVSWINFERVVKTRVPGLVSVELEFAFIAFWKEVYDFFEGAGPNFNKLRPTSIRCSWWEKN